MRFTGTLKWYRGLVNGNHLATDTTILLKNYSSFTVGDVVFFGTSYGTLYTVQNWSSPTLTITPGLVDPITDNSTISKYYSMDVSSNEPELGDTEKMERVGNLIYKKVGADYQSIFSHIKGYVTKSFTWIIGTNPTLANFLDWEEMIFGQSITLTETYIECNEEKTKESQGYFILKGYTEIGDSVGADGVRYTTYQVDFDWVTNDYID